MSLAEKHLRQKAAYYLTLAYKCQNTHADYYKVFKRQASLYTELAEKVRGNAIR